MLVYNGKREVNCFTAMLGAEIRNAIQNWRKENKLPIDFRIPTLYVYYKDEIIKTVLIEGITDTFTKQHLFELCLVDKVEFHNIIQLGHEYDLVFWSPLGGTIGHCDCLHGNTQNIQKELDVVIEKQYYNKYA